MDILTAISTFNVIRALVLYVFLTITFFASAKFLIWGDTEEKNIQKIIGGLIVFIVAIISQNPWVFSVSLFIGGLIIATEKFMQSLAAILKAEGKYIPDTIKALNTADVSKATKMEIEKQKEEETKEIEEKIKFPEKEGIDDKQIKTSSVSNKNRFIQFQQMIEETKLVENLVSNYFSKKYVDRFTPEVKLENNYGKIIVDGAVHYSSDKDKLNLDNILGLIEIKYLSSIKNKFILEIHARRVLEKIRFLFIHKQILMVFVSKEIDKGLALETKERLEKKYNGVVLAFFIFSEDKILIPVNVPEMKDFVV